MDINLSTIKHVHFIGIGGIGISAIARMMLHEGKVVSGQDINETDIIHELQKAGATITIGQSLDAIPRDADLIVYTIAIENYAPELFTALQAQLVPIRSYPQMLHIVTEGKYTIAISGTHGKTTTTAMIAGIARDAQFDPTVIVGSLLVGKKDEPQSNFIAGHSRYFIVEACEYRRSFLNINPNILVITNIETDHLDYYKDIEDIISAFRELAAKVPRDGYIICNPNDLHIKDVIEGLPATIVDYSLYYNTNLKLKVPGIHNKKDAAAATAVGVVLSIAQGTIEASLCNFRGTWRRFEYKGTLGNGAHVYDDYAHHPTEIQAMLEGARELYPRKHGYNITVIFQPHLFSRTKALLEEFAHCFTDADTVILLPIYRAREADDGSITSEILAEKIVGPISKVYNSFTDATAYIQGHSLTSKNILITVGAGEAYKVLEPLLRH